MRSLVAVVSLVLAFAASGAVVENGGFESVRNGRPVGWQALGPGVSVKLFASSGWSRAERVLNIADYKAIRVCLGVHRGTGTVWFDNVRVEESEFSPLTIVNRSFEEGDAKTLEGWSQEAPGRRTFRDTTVWTRFPGQKFGRGASARVTSPDGKRTRIWQEVPIVGRGEPNVDYVLTFDWRAVDLKGEVYVEVYGLESNGDLGRSLPLTPLSPPFPPEQFGKCVAELSLPAAGATGLSQRLPLAAAERNRAWSVTARFRIPHLKKGSVALTVQPSPDPESAVVRETTRQDGFWQELSLNFIPGDTDPEVTIRVEAAGIGPNWPAALVYVDNVRVGPAAITPTPKRLEWLPVDQSFPIPKELTVGVEGDPGRVVASAVRLFTETLKEKTGQVAVLRGPLGTDKRGVELTVAPEDGQRREAESYSLRVGRDRVTIVSADERGALYAMQTLLELIQRSPKGGSVFLAANIDDVPDLPFRGIYWAGGDRKLRDRFARLRYNAVLVENLPYVALPAPEARRLALEAFEHYRGLGIEPIPVLQSFGHAHSQLSRDPNVIEGFEVADEKLVLVDTKPVALAHPNVIRTESTDIRITNEAGNRTFLEGPDYEVLPGEMKVGFKAGAAPFRVRRTQNSRIPDGATVLASYDYAAKGADSYCPNEPRAYAIVRRTIQHTIRTLRPKYLHIGHDEPMQMGTDSRCRKSGRTNAENFALEVWRLYRMIKAEDPNIRLMMWDDAINPYSHGFLANSARPHNVDTTFRNSRRLLEDPTAPAVDLLPKDIIQCVWFYGRSDPSTAGQKSLEFFSKKGYPTTGSPYANRICARRWSVACKRAKDAGMPCLGVICTAWSGAYHSLEVSANTAWRVPAHE